MITQIIIGIVIAIVSSTITYLFSQHQFYNSFYYQNSIDFVKRYHLKLLSSIHNVNYHIYLISNPEIDVDMDIKIDGLKNALKFFGISINEYVANGGVILLRRLNERLAALILGLQGRQDLWNMEEPYSEETGEFNFNASIFPELLEQFNKISLKHIVSSYKAILKK